MAKPIPDISLLDLSKIDEVKSINDTVIDSTISRINKRKPSRDLVLGTLSGWLIGVGSYKVGKIAAFGVGGSIILLHFASEFGYIHINWDRIKETLSRSEELVENVVQFLKKNSCFSVGFIGGFFFDDSSASITTIASSSEEEPQTGKKQLPIEPIPIKPAETFKHTEEPIQPTYAQSKPLSHSPKISPSSIPNPNPSVMSTKQSESGYSIVGGYPFSIPGYSAFQPVSHPKVTHSNSSIQPSVQPVTSSSKLITSHSDFGPYSNITAEASVPCMTSQPVSLMSSSPQEPTSATIESLSSMPLTSTLSSASPIITAASMGSTPQTTSVLSVPPISANSLESSLSSLTPKSKSVESIHSMSIEQPTQSMPRMSMPMLSTMPSESLTEGTLTTTATTIPLKSSIQRIPSQHSCMPSDLLKQRMTLEHSMPPMVTLSSDPLNQRINVGTSSMLPSATSTQRTLATMPVMQRIPLEHSVRPNTSLESSMPPDMSTMPIMTSESIQRIPLGLSMSSMTIPTETTMHQTMTLTPNVLPESLRQQIPLDNSMRSMPNLSSDPTEQRMPIEYYMPPLPMIPSELIMRRMQLFQYMQSLQTMASEPSIALMPQIQPYGIAIPQVQSATTQQTTSSEQSVPVTSTVTSGTAVPHKQPLLSTSLISSQSMAPMHVELEAQTIASLSTKTEPVTASMTYVSLVPSSSSSSISIIPQDQSVASIPLHSIQTSTLPLDESTLVQVQSEQTVVSTTTPNTPTSLMQCIQPLHSMSFDINQSKPSISLVQTMPLISDQISTTTPRMQIAQPMSSTTSNKLIDPLMHGLPLVEAVPMLSSKSSEPSMTSRTQMPLVQSAPYESTKPYDTSIQRTSLEQPMGALFTLTSASSEIKSIPLVSSTDETLKSISNIQIANPLQSNNVQQIPSGTCNSTKQQIDFVSHLQSTSFIESDKLIQSSEPSMLQKPVVKSLQSVSFAPSKLSSVSITQSNLRLNLPLPSISTLSSESSLATVSHMPSTQSMPQLSTMTLNPSMETMQRIQSQHTPFMSIKPSSNTIITKEFIPPLSLVQPMSSMTLAPSMQPISLIDPTPSAPDSFQMMSSGQFMQAKHSEISVPHPPPDSKTPTLNLDENDKQSEVRSILHDNYSDPSQIQNNTNDENHFTSKVNFSATTSEDVEPTVASLTQKSQNTIEVPLQTTTKEIKRRPLERFSLKTSIPISKIDMMSVPNPPDTSSQAPLAKKLSFNVLKINNGTKVEKHVQRNVIIRGTGTESEANEYQPMVSSPHTKNITKLISTAETINVTDKQFRKLEAKIESKEMNSTGSQLSNASSSRTIALSNKEVSKLGFKSNSSDTPGSEQNNQILFIQNKNCTNKKMILTIQQQNSQVLLKRKNVEKNPLRFSSQMKKNKEESVMITEHIPSKVVALKRLHQGDCDEDDFENLITENQIYGNKIVVKEKIQGTLQEQDLKIKNNKTNRLIQSETKKIVKSSNFVYLSNVKYPPNIMMYKNNLKTNIDFNKDNKIILNESKITEANSTSKACDSVIKSKKLPNVPNNKENPVLNTDNNLQQITANKNSKTDIVTSNINQKILMSSKKLQQLPKTEDNHNETIEPALSIPTGQSFKKILQKPIQQNKVILNIVPNTCHPEESISQPKTEITETPVNTNEVEEEISSLDIYEKRRRLRRLKYLLNRGIKDVQKSDSKKPPNNGRYIITPEKIKAEIYKEFASTRIIIEDEGVDMESEYEDESKEYESLIQAFGPANRTDCEKMEFLSNFMLGTQDICKDILWNKKERIIQRDKIASAYIAAGRLDRLTEEDTPKEVITTPYPNNSVSVNLGDLNDSGSGFRMKQTFLSHLKLKHVKPRHRAVYERTWQEILKERKRRDAPEKFNHVFKQPRTHTETVELNTNCELQILTEIKNSVTENNNLIKKRLDLSCQDEGDSIKTLAEKNFTELDRLSKMADRSVKHFSGQDTRKRDLNPGFDSANIQTAVAKLESPKNYPYINIPSISKIISLKTSLEPCSVTSTQATSMDEPQNSAAGVDEMFSEVNMDKIKEVACQTENAVWPGVEEMIKMYKDFENARKKEVLELNRRNTALKVEGAHISRNTSRHSDTARALLAERRNLSLEERVTKQAIQRLFNAVDVVRSYF